MPFKMTSFFILATSFIFQLSAHAAGMTPEMEPHVLSNLTTGATPLPSDCVSVTFTPTSGGSIWFESGTYTFTKGSGCATGALNQGIFFSLDLSADSTVTNYFAAPFGVNGLTPWPTGFVSNINSHSSGNTDIDIALPVVFQDGLATQQVNLGFSLNGTSIDPAVNLAVLNAALANSANIRVYPLKSMTGILTVNNSGTPAGFATAAYPAEYPALTLQRCTGVYDVTTQTCSASWVLAGISGVMNAWESSWVAQGLIYGYYKLSGNTLSFGQAVFSPIQNDTVMQLFPFSSTARIAYQQTVSASGSVQITMPAAPIVLTGQPMPKITGYLVDPATQAVLATVSNLSWGATVTVDNLAPGRSLVLDIDPVLFLNSNGTTVNKETFMPASFTPPESGSASVTVTGQISTVSAWQASFNLTATGVTPSANASITFTDNTANLTLVERIPFGQVVSLPVPGTITHTVFYAPNIAIINKGSKSSAGYLIASPKSGTVQSSNIINFTYYLVPQVQGWPTGHIAMGNLTGDGEDAADAEGLRARENVIDAIFKYSGANGAGDQGLVVYPTWTNETIAEAKELTISKGASVIPVMVDYTAQMSGGTNFDDVSIQSFIQKHFTNLAMDAVALATAVSAGDIQGGSIVLNPDLMGMLAQNHLEQQLADAMSAASPAINIQNAAAIASCVVASGVPANQAALDAQYTACVQNFSTAGVPAFTNDFAGWVAANNWLVNHFGGSKVSFGWMLNIWSAGNNHAANPCETASSTWLHYATSASDVTTCYTANNMNILNEYHVYDGYPNRSTNPIPEYVAFDKYEMDVVPGALGIGYLFNYRDWTNYFMAIQQTSRQLYVGPPSPGASVPVMLFQMPGGHIRSTNDVDTRAWPSPHISTIADYIFGDPLLKADFSGAEDVGGYLDTILADTVYNCSSTFGCEVSHYLTTAWSTTPTQDWTQSNFDTLIKSDVFAILWGGGTGPTTSIAKYPTDDGGWLASKIQGTLN